MRLAVTFARDTANPTKLPAEWPAVVTEIHDNSEPILYPKRAMTPLEYQQYRASYQPVYDAWALAVNLKQAKIDTGETLWQACYDYNFQFYSGGAYTQILELKLAGFARARTAGNWILALWSEYYRRKAILWAAESVEQVAVVSLDFGSFGPAPYSVPEMLAEAMGG